MALIIPPDHYQALIPFKHDRVTRSAAVTFGVRQTEDTAAPTDLADEILLAFSAAWLTVIDNEVEVGPVQVTFDQGAQGRGSVSGSATFRGGRSGVSTVSNTALLMRKNTDRVGRPGRGRMFMPWSLAENVVDEVGALTNAAIDDSNTRGATLLTGLNTRDMVMVILHDENVPGTTTPSLVTSLVADPVAGTQRRRMRF